MNKNTNKPVINSFNDWDPLKEIIIGTVDGATVPPLDIMVKTCSYPKNWGFFEKYAGQPFPEELITPARKELDYFCYILEQEGVVVKRPEPINFATEFVTPNFTSTGLYAAMPRDILTVIGNEIIEAPMAWRSRYFESQAYQKLMLEYINKGGHWTIAPKSGMHDQLYNHNYVIKSIEERNQHADRDEFVTNNSAICFDAADIVRIGKDIFIQRSQVTNDAAIYWLKNHLAGRGFRVHKLKFKDPNPMHIDATFVPLRPGLILVNPDRPCYQLELFKKAGWDIVEAIHSTLSADWPLYLSSKWLCMNILLLDEKRVVVEKEETGMQNLFKKLGFDVIAIPFKYVYTFGGSFHCTSCDIYREGTIQDYGFDRFFKYSETTLL